MYVCLYVVMYVCLYVVMYVCLFCPRCLGSSTTMWSKSATVSLGLKYVRSLLSDLSPYSSTPPPSPAYPLSLSLSPLTLHLGFPLLHFHLTSLPPLSPRSTFTLLPLFLPSFLSPSTPPLSLPPLSFPPPSLPPLRPLHPLPPLPPPSSPPPGPRLAVPLPIHNHPHPSLRACRPISHLRGPTGQ